ncbi:BppU family phage baseplate upper protein [Bacillus wiedmannii]|uniref:BppU family phage baseplate upper protein n=1 Tax=Bacillus wiedmannii TaxID=1890302 RepID=UPI001247402A
MRTETIVLDLSNQSMPRTITARENDRNGFKIVGNLKERGKVVDLTGFAVFYEAISPLGFFVRDIAVITNFRDGVFEYTVSKEAVSSAGVWVGYFAFEKGTERFTTQDIRISLGSDVKSGSVQLENYIAEFDKLKKRIDTLQIAVDKADIVKRTGDTMTGTLIMANAQVGGDMVFNNAGGRRSRLFIDNSNGGTAFTLVTEKTAGKGDWDYTEHLRIGDRRNWMKNSGDTMTGNLIMDNDKFVIFKDTSGVGLYGLKTTTTGALTLRDVKNGKDVFYASGNDFVVTADFKTKNDTDWIPLTLLNGVKQQSSQPASAVKRSGNVVNIVCAITDFKDKQVIANVPAIFRPDREMLFTCNYFQGLVLKNGYVIIKPNGDIYLEGLEATVSLYRFSLTYIV